MELAGNRKLATVTRAVTSHISPTNVIRYRGSWEKKGKRSLALGPQITDCDDKRGPNKTQHPSLLNETRAGGHDLLPEDFMRYHLL